jgi:hypothetical protein
MAGLFDDDDPDPRPRPAVRVLPTTSRRGRFTVPENQQGNKDLKEAMEGKDEYVLMRTMAAALYRLGAEPLNKLAAEMLRLLEVKA